MKTLRIGLTSLSFMLGLCITTQAQETTTVRKVRFGIGIAITESYESVSWYEVNPVSIFVPIDLLERFRIEPEIGIIRISEDETERYKRNSKGLSIGIGIFPMINRENVNIYYGMRMGLIRTYWSTYYGGELMDDRPQNGYFIAPAVGGQLFLTNSFALGGEAQFRYISLSGEGTSSMSKVELSTLERSTRALFFIRFFF